MRSSSDNDNIHDRGDTEQTNGGTFYPSEGVCITTPSARIQYSAVLIKFSEKASYFHSAKFSDLVIQTSDDQLFKVHKLVVCAQSEVFRGNAQSGKTSHRSSRYMVVHS